MSDPFYFLRLDVLPVFLADLRAEFFLEQLGDFLPVSAGESNFSFFLARFVTVSPLMFVEADASA